ncbi:MAG: 16S rRNA (cytidine(1402)-2'-O)-methyltransferase [Pelotomaculum sp.]|uniref:Ribosomal RNA small subunit methyltransferase I n=1 Tax=Pelotomaculum thermopropionicum (strain DSM 13744 / JCM 10971 / SI) TaxID=370438 RepID=A5D694_PELTS|nr:16S rRNA (cytidine(1402)-2'-O)-methyltransferase [Pelotomaculum sp.]BAF58247.1 predicted methyltransferase [Pelotomaculum thermopropionicum SI]
MAGTKGVLYLCATPIGNLEDITLRALRVLREVDLIAAEDTRRTRKLLSHYGIHTPLTSYHQHNRRKKGEYLLDMLESGKNVALVTDAGLPGISDPGSELVKAALEKGIRTVPLPGPSAGITALVVSGLPSDLFVFAGFLPSSKKSRVKELQELRRQRGTLIFYEAPHRLKETLADVLEVLGDRPAAAARELTKVHEEVLRGPLSKLLEYFNEVEPQGEFTLVVAGAEAGDEAEGVAGAARPGPDPAARVAMLEAEGMGRREAIKEVARLLGLSRREVYRLVVEAGEKK